MNRSSLAALLVLPVSFVVACGSPTHLVAPQRTSASPSPAPLPAANGSACDTSPAPGTGTVMIDWVDFVRLQGVQYIAGMDGPLPPLSVAQLGPVVGRVHCQLSALSFHEAPGSSVDGDAAFLSRGTEVHAIVGFAPKCRVAALIQGRYRVYLAHHTSGGGSKAVPCARAGR